MRKKMNPIKTYLKDHKGKVIQILLLVFISISAFACVPMFTKLVLDNYATLGMKEVLTYGLMYFAAIVIFLYFEYRKKIAIVAFQRDFETEIRHDIFENITKMNHDQMHEKNDEDYMNSILNDTESVFDNYVYTKIQLLISLITFLVYMVYMIYLNGILSLIVIFSCIVSFFIPKLVGNKMNGKRKAESDGKSEFMTGMKDLLANREVFSSHTSHAFTTHFDSYNRHFEDLRYDLWAYESFVNIFSAFSLYFINIMTFISGVILVYLKLIEVSSLVAIIGYVDLVAFPVRDIIYLLITMRSSEEIIEKLQNYFDEKNDLDNQPKDFQSLDVKDLSYQIGSFKMNHVNMHFGEGKKYAIVGDNASGKSTLLKLIAKEAEAPKGMIFIDGKDLCETDIQNLIFYSSRQSLMKGSVEENISVVNPEQSIHSFVYKLVERIGQKEIDFFGKNLSFGEQARVALARAYHAPQKVLILDEIFANIDQKSELELTESLLKSNKTVLLITHNRSEEYLKQFDQVYVMPSQQSSQ